MSGTATVKIELADGTVVQYQEEWSGGNPAFEGAEGQKAATKAASQARVAIESTHGKLPRSIW